MHGGQLRQSLPPAFKVGVKTTPVENCSEFGKQMSTETGGSVKSMGNRIFIKENKEDIY
jgi:hypothetical protein